MQELGQAAPAAGPLVTSLSQTNHSLVSLQKSTEVLKIPVEGIIHVNMTWANCKKLLG